MKLMTSTDYSKFEMLAVNRDVRNTMRLEKSMSRHGWIPAFPAYVVQVGKKLKIKDGHHRFICAQKLGIPVVYVVCDDDISVSEIQSTTTPWSLNDYLTSYVRLGYPDYIEVKEFQSRTGIKLNVCISILSGVAVTSTNYTAAFKGGTYKVGNTQYAETVASVVATIAKAGVEWAANNNLVAAISILALYEGTDLNRLKTRIKSNKTLLEKRSTVYQYLELLEEIYNRKKR